MGIEQVIRDLKKAYHDTNIKMLNDLVNVLYAAGDTKENLKKYIEDKEKELGL